MPMFNREGRNEVSEHVSSDSCRCPPNQSLAKALRVGRGVRVMSVKVQVSRLWVVADTSRFACEK